MINLRFKGNIPHGFCNSSASCVFIYALSSKRIQITVIWTGSDLHLKLSTKPLDALFTFVLRLSLDFFVEITIKANRIGPENRDWGALAGKMHERKISEGAELIEFSLRRHCWGSKLHAGYSIPLRFYFTWSAF